MRVLVTGGAGFIGSHLVDQLVENGDEVIVIDDFSYGREENLHRCADQILLVRASILDEELLCQAARGVEVIFHLAAISSVQRSIEDPDGTYAINAMGTQRIINVAKENGAAVIFSSSSAVYGDLEELPARETSPASPMSPYGRHKLLSEKLLSQSGSDEGIRSASLRYFNVYGPRQNPRADYAAAVPAFLAKALAGQPLTIYGDGLSTRDYIHVRDVVSANLAAAAKANSDAKVFNIGSGKSITVVALAEAILEATETSLPLVHLPPRPGEIRRSECEVLRAKQELGFEAKVPLREGLQESLESIRPILT